MTMAGLSLPQSNLDGVKLQEMMQKWPKMQPASLLKVYWLVWCLPTSLTPLLLLLSKTLIAWPCNPRESFDENDSLSTDTKRALLLLQKYLPPFFAKKLWWKSYLFTRWKHRHVVLRCHDGTPAVCLTDLSGRWTSPSGSLLTLANAAL